MSVTGYSEDRPVVAIAMVLGAMFVFVSTDGMAKHLAASMSAQQIVWVRYTLISLLMIPLIAKRAGTLRTTRPISSFASRLDVAGRLIAVCFRVGRFTVGTLHRDWVCSAVVCHRVVHPLFKEKSRRKALGRGWYRVFRGDDHCETGWCVIPMGDAFSTRFIYVLGVRVGHHPTHAWQ